MTLLVAKNSKQTQSITIGLKIICEFCPANTCLREILQNGDDAWATEIEYVLDIKSYLNEPLLYDALQVYHGSTLLIKNNSVFIDEDFDSFSSVGGSRKGEDTAATRKSGMAFNSVPILGRFLIQNRFWTPINRELCRWGWHFPTTSTSWCVIFSLHLLCSSSSNLHLFPQDIVENKRTQPSKKIWARLQLWDPGAINVHQF